MSQSLEHQVLARNAHCLYALLPRDIIPQLFENGVISFDDKKRIQLPDKTDVDRMQMLVTIIHYHLHGKNYPSDEELPNIAICDLCDKDECDDRTSYFANFLSALQGTYGLLYEQMKSELRPVVKGFPRVQLTKGHNVTDMPCVFAVQAAEKKSNEDLSNQSSVDYILDLVVPSSEKELDETDSLQTVDSAAISSQYLPDKSTAVCAESSVLCSANPVRSSVSDVEDIDESSCDSSKFGSENDSMMSQSENESDLEREYGGLVLEDYSSPDPSDQESRSPSPLLSQCDTPGLIVPVQNKKLAKFLASINQQMCSYIERAQWRDLDKFREDLLLQCDGKLPLVELTSNAYRAMQSFYTGRRHDALRRCDQVLNSSERNIEVESSLVFMKAFFTDMKKAFMSVKGDIEYSRELIHSGHQAAHQLVPSYAKARLLLASGKLRASMYHNYPEYRNELLKHEILEDFMKCIEIYNIIDADIRSLSRVFLTMIHFLVQCDIVGNELVPRNMSPSDQKKVRNYLEHVETKLWLADVPYAMQTEFYTCKLYFFINTGKYAAALENLEKVIHSIAASGYTGPGTDWVVVCKNFIEKHSDSGLKRRIEELKNIGRFCALAEDFQHHRNGVR